MNKEIKVGSKVFVKAKDTPYTYQKDSTGVVVYKRKDGLCVIYSKEWKGYGHSGMTVLPSDLYKELITDGKLERESCWYVRDDKLELIEEPIKHNINITIDGKSVIAEMDGKEAVAKCHPDDDFNVLTGAVIALHRLLGNEGINRLVISKELNIDTSYRVKKMKMLLNSVFGASLNTPTGTPDVKEETKPVVKVVYREAKFGEYVKVVGINNNFNRGEIVRCVLENNEYHCARFLNEFTKFDMLIPSDYVVLENYEAAQEWKKNHPKGFKIGDLVVLSKDHEAAFAVLKKGHAMRIDDIKDGKFYLRSASDDIEYRGFTMVVKDPKGVFEKVNESEIKESSGKQNEYLKKDELEPGDYVVLTKDDSTPKYKFKKGDVLEIKEVMGKLLDGCKLYHMVRMRDNAGVIMLDKFVRKIKTNRNKNLRKGDKLLVLGDTLSNFKPGDIATYIGPVNAICPTNVIIAVDKDDAKHALNTEEYIAIENYDEIKEFLEGK